MLLRGGDRITEGMTCCENADPLPGVVESSSSETTRRGAPVLSETSSVRYLAASSR